MAKQTTPGIPALATTSTANAPTPIGVEKGYTAAVPFPTLSPSDTANLPLELQQQLGGLQGTFDKIPPRYFAGEEWQPASLPPAQMITLQNNLFAAGLYKGDFTRGSWGPADANAYADLLTRANASGQDRDTALAQVMANPVTKTTARQPLTVVLSNTKDIQDVVRQVGNSLYQGQLPDSTVNSIVDAVHANEQAAQQQSYNLAPGGGQMELGQGIGAGGQVTSSGLQNLTTDIVKQRHPNEVGANEFANAMDAIMANIRGNVSGYSGLLK